MATTEYIPHKRCKHRRSVAEHGTTIGDGARKTGKIKPQRLRGVERHV